MWQSTSIDLGDGSTTVSPFSFFIFDDLYNLLAQDVTSLSLNCYSCRRNGGFPRSYHTVPAYGLCLLTCIMLIMTTWKKCFLVWTFIDFVLAVCVTLLGSGDVRKKTRRFFFQANFTTGALFMYGSSR